MQLVHQAEFARMRGVSRKTVTEWKRHGYLVFSGRQIDVTASIEKLRRAGKNRAAFETPARNPLPDSVHLDSVRALPADPSGLHPLVGDLAIVASTAAADATQILLRHLPPSTVREIVDELAATLRRGVIELLDEDDVVPPSEYETWTDHPAFAEPHMAAAEWDELVAEAASAR